MHAIPHCRRWPAALVLAIALSWVSFGSAQQVTPDQQAAMLLNSARKAYNEKNYPFAVARFREFLQKFGNHKDAPSARYGLGLAILESPERDYQAAFNELAPLAGNKAMPEYPYVLYYQGYCQRGLGTKLLTQAIATPPQAVPLRQQANQRFEEAAKSFQAAEVAFSERVKSDPKATEIPEEREWAARSRCDLAEMQLRTLKVKEARETSAPFEANPLFKKSKHRPLGLYYYGYASYLMKDRAAAGRTLTQLAPYEDPVFGTHAQYLVGRTYHSGDERPEAANAYQGVIDTYTKQKAAAVEALKRPDLLKDPEVKARLEGLVKNPAPDHVSRAGFFLGVLRYEDGKFDEALPRFVEFVKANPGNPLQAEAELRQGFCLVQLRNYKDAIPLLQALSGKEARLADQALLWMGKAQVGSADPANAAVYAQTLGNAIQTLRTAADRANQLAGTDPEAKLRRGEILLEVADTQQLAKQFKDAAGTYNQIIAEKLLPERDEEIMQRQITALHLGADYPASDQLCAKFVQTYPKSTLLNAVLFRFAENAYFAALAAEKNPSLPNRAVELPKLQNEVIKRYSELLAKFPDFEYANAARYGLGMIHYRKGELDKAKAVLEKIPAPDRSGELAAASYLLADCLLRQVPTKVDDALAAGRAQEELEAASKLLDEFLSQQPNGSQTPDALLKLGYCHQRLAGLLAQPQAKQTALASARAAYEKLAQQFPKSPEQPTAIFERAKVLALGGDPNGAMNELRRFNADPALKAAPAAPLALLQLATILRGQNKPLDAAAVLDDCRKQHEANLAKDPARAGWAALLVYHHGVALREAGKLPEARAVLDALAKQSTTRPEAAEAALRFAQCLKDEGMAAVIDARKQLAQPGLPPPAQQAAKQKLDAGVKSVRDAGAYLESHIGPLKEKQPTWETRARMLYDAAWAYRIIGEMERDAEREKLQAAELKRLTDEAAKKTPAGAAPPVIAAPEIPWAKVPLQPSEKKTRELYQTLLTGFSDLPLALDGRFELAELLSERAEYPEALKLLGDALEKEPRDELAEKIRLRLGECQAAKGDFKEALGLFEGVANNIKSPLSGQGHYQAAECLLKAKDYPKAAAHLVLFRDNPQYQNQPGLSDRALLRLGHVFALQNQWDPSRQAMEVLTQRFPNSPWIHEARYGMGWAQQSAGQYDAAVNSYTPVVNALATELAAKAQLQIGLCRLTQKRYPEALAALYAVPLTFDYPELSAAALAEAARCHIEQKQNEPAAKLLRRVIKDYGNSKWAAVAKQRLDALPAGS
jgi:TolA-binding protein